GPEGTHTVNSADQLTDFGFSYDADGNLTTGGSLAALAYNGISQTTSITPVGGTPTTYAYAGAGQAERTGAGPTAGLGLSSPADTTALHGLLGLAAETTNGVTTSYVRDAHGSLIAERTPEGDFYYVFDGQGSVIALVDPSGTQRAAYTYDPYGANATATTMNGSLPPNPWRWNASYLDATGLYKMGERYYDPTLGRFTQVDPVKGGSANNYDYASGDPCNYADLTGRNIDRVHVSCPPGYGVVGVFEAFGVGTGKLKARLSGETRYRELDTFKISADRGKRLFTYTVRPVGAPARIEDVRVEARSGIVNIISARCVRNPSLARGDFVV
ncbi:MAG: RHS repeat-associated core domain-containing protein, partial [Actinomycetota bacterium]|nr:RHS repeat-associated core domain-containing protein [Actinomycetota bacterium]